MTRFMPLSLFILLFNSNIFAEDQVPEDLGSIVQDNVSLVVSLVEQNADLSVEALRPKIDEVLVNLINFETISLGVIGKYREDATAEQKVAFQKKLRISLGSLFIKSFRSLRPENINVVDVKSKGNKGRAKVQFTTSDNVKVELLFSMRKIGDSWLVVNFLVDGVNMGLAYRNVFDARMKEYGDINMLISHWLADIES